MRLVKCEGVDKIEPYDVYRPEGCLGTEIYKPLNISPIITGIVFIGAMIIQIDWSYKLYAILLFIGTALRWRFLYTKESSLKISVVTFLIVGWLMMMPLEALYITPILWYWKRRESYIDILTDIMFIGMLHIMWFN